MGKQRPGGITWCDYSWNPLRGCSRISAGCKNCYAETMAGRFDKPGLPFHGFVDRTCNGPVWNGRVELVERLSHGGSAPTNAHPDVGCKQASQPGAP